MSTYLRKNAWDANNGGQFKDQSGNFTDLYWYAKAVQVMQARPISDPTSWWFYAAIHGEFLLNPIPKPTNPNQTDYTYLNWVNITYISPAAKLDTPPSQTLTDLYWDQCQHGTWFFPPWHRGYLVSLESTLRDIIANQLHGPADWSLPYWNYLSQSAQYAEDKIPPAFTLRNLPDGTTNPLFVPERYGPNGNGDIYVEVGPDIQTAANDECQWDTIYTKGSTESPTGAGDLFGYFYGGGVTGFLHSTRHPKTGDLEQNPHNFVHGMVGGQSTSTQQLGLMGVPATAALDPVFYLHHANIDRMWAAWNETGNNNNPSSNDWLLGPTAQGDRKFVMPLNAAGDSWGFNPKDVNRTENVNYNGSNYAYTYDDLSLTSYDTTPPERVNRNILANRFERLGATALTESIKMADKDKQELVGASSSSLTLSGSNVKTSVTLQKKGWKSVSRSLMESSVTNLPNEVYLQLEGVKGGSDANFLSVYVNDKFVKAISLFGLLEATLDHTPHGGSGLSFEFNITNIVDDLHLGNNIDVDTLHVEIKAKNALSDGREITIDRIGIYRSSQ